MTSVTNFSTAYFVGELQCCVMLHNYSPSVDWCHSFSLKFDTKSYIWTEIFYFVDVGLQPALLQLDNVQQGPALRLFFIPFQLLT